MNRLCDALNPIDSTQLVDARAGGLSIGCFTIDTHRSAFSP